MIVTEGPDGVGKSTLVAHLKDKFGLEIGRRRVANRDELYKVTRQDTYSALADAVKGTAPAYIWDRLFISEFVYADIVGRPCEFKDYERHFILEVMNAIEFPMIVCLPPYHVVVENCAKAHQMKGVSENLHTIYNRYEEGDLPWPENTLWYDYTGSNGLFATLEEVEEEIAGYLEVRKQRQAWN